jgi:alkyl hydroperoxide reductase subunit AhpC
MITIGSSAPHFRVPAVAGGALIQIDSTRFRGQYCTVSFLPLLGLWECALLQIQARKFEEKNVVLLGVITESALFAGPWRQSICPNGLAAVSDPLGRLARSFGVLRRPASTKCQSFVIDPESILRYHLVHDLNEPGIGALLEIIEASQVPELKRSVTSSRHTECQNLVAGSERRT